MTNGRDPDLRRDPEAIMRLAIARRISRRHFLVGTGAGLGALALAGCAPSTGGLGGRPAPVAATSATP